MRRTARIKPKARMERGAASPVGGDVMDRLENYLRENPLKVLVQAGAIGCALRLLPVRALVSLGMRVAGPMVWMKALWDLGERLDQKLRPPQKTEKDAPRNKGKNGKSHPAA